MVWSYQLVFTLVLCTLIGTLIQTSSSKRCWKRSNNTYLYLATKTPYRYIANMNDTPVYFPGCKAVRSWIVIRHGTRNPGAKLIRNMKEKLPVFQEMILNAHKTKQGKLCEEDLKALKIWRPNIEETEKKVLTHEGEDEMLELAERFQNRFPKLFPEPYKNSTYKFKYTATQRTEESARYFTTGLFGRRVSQHVWYPEALHRDPILRFYKLCWRWRSEVDKNPASLLERQAFEKGPEMTFALEDISTRLGLNTTITIDTAHVMYMTCSFETAWDRRITSPWCAVFSEDNIKAFEYAEDLEYYWIDGYGYNITYRQACPAVRDMLQHFQTEAEPRTVVYFTHSGTVLKLLSHLSLYRDNSSLLHSNYGTTGTSRQWRVGAIDSFASNIAFILFRCGDQYKVLTMHQERPITLPGCPSDDLCPLDLLVKLYWHSVNDCNFDEMCALVAPAAAR